MNNLETMLRNVIVNIEGKISQNGNSEKLSVLLCKYQCALKELLNTGKVTTNLIGGCRAYLDSYSDYVNNELLDSMYAVEKIMKQQLKSEQFPYK